MLNSYFSDTQILIFGFVALLNGISLYFFSVRNDVKRALLFLVLGGLAARILVVSLDDFFHTWDEQYHALVAKNMAQSPFVPKLFVNPVLNYCPTVWTEAHIWLHKQPLFLWLIALSIKLFGASFFSVRLPSVIMSTLLILTFYRIGRLAVNHRTGFLAAFLYSTCNYLLDFTSGIYNTDHNDIAFIFFISLSIWAFTEYVVLDKKYFIWIIGIAVGLAILTKWLTGFLVFSGWGIVALLSPTWQARKQEIINMLKALAVSLLVCVPWQVYIVMCYPEVSLTEYSYSSRHFFEVLEGHGGDLWYYFDQAVIQYGTFGTYLLLIALPVFFYNIKNIKIKISYGVMLAATYIFFSIAKTKMPAFCLVISPIIFLALAYLLDIFLNWMKQISISKKLILVFELIILIAIGIINFDVELLQANHTGWKPTESRRFYDTYKIYAAKLGKELHGKYDIDKTVVVNCHETDNIPIMFFSGYTAYDRVPTYEEYLRLRKQGYKIIFIDNYTAIPDYINNDTAIVFISNLSKKDKSRTKINIKASNEKYICADLANNYLVVANRDTALEWETFILFMFENNKCSIRSSEGKYFSAELSKNNEIYPNRVEMSEWETFTLIQHENNLVSFKAANGKYWSVDAETKQIFAIADSIGENETFEMIKKE